VSPQAHPRRAWEHRSQLEPVARAANQGQLVTSPGRDDLTAMLRVCGTLRDSLKQVLLANLKSWEEGSP
jgi:hypothetical protein